MKKKSLSQKNDCLCLDVDGVLVSSHREAFVIAMLTQHSSLSLKKIDFESKLYKKFTQLRYCVGPAWHYYYLLRFLENLPNNVQFPNQATASSFLDYIKKHRTHELEQVFQKSFFETRSYLRNAQYKEWLTLFEPFSFLEWIKDRFLTIESRVFIVTTKDEETVYTLLNYYGLNIKKDRILGRHTYDFLGSKKNILNSIKQSYKCRKIILIDDSFIHAKGLEKEHNIKVLIPDWGYVNPYQKTHDFKLICETLEKYLLI